MTKSKDTDQDSSSFNNKRKRGENQYDGIEKSQTKQVKRSPELREAHVYFNSGTVNVPHYSNDSSSVQSSSFSNSSNTSSTSSNEMSSSSLWNGQAHQQPSIIFNINCRVNNSYYQTGTFNYSNPFSQPLSQSMNNVSFNSANNTSTRSSSRLGKTQMNQDDDSDDELDSDSILTDLTDY